MRIGAVFSHDEVGINVSFDYARFIIFTASMRIDRPPSLVVQVWVSIFFLGYSDNAGFVHNLPGAFFSLQSVRL
jgi:hypothetical protein